MQLTSRSQEVMNQLEHFEIVEGYAVFRPIGEVVKEELGKLVTSAIVYAREQQIKKLLIIATDVYGFESPDVATRYYLTHDWARAAQGIVCAVLVLRVANTNDREKIGVIAAGNEGFRCNVFATEEEALVWLQGVKWIGPDGKIQFTNG